MENRTRICLMYVNADNIDKDVCVDTSYVPKIGEKIHLGKISCFEYDVDLIVIDRKCIFDSKGESSLIPTWELYCQLIENGIEEN